MATNLRLLYPDIPFAANYITPIYSHSYDTNILNSIGGAKHCKAYTLENIFGSYVIEYDLGPTNLKTSSAIGIARADHLVSEGCSGIYLKASSSSYFYPATLSNLKVWLKSNHYLDGGSANHDITNWTAFRRGVDDTSAIKVFTQGTAANRPKATRSDNRANWFSYTEQFDNAAWIKVNSTISANTTNNPIDSTATADSFVEDSALTIKSVGQTADQKVTKGESYRLSIYVKPGSRTQVSIILGGAGFPGIPFANFSLSAAGSVIASGGGASASISLVNGFYLCSIVATATVTGISTAIISPMSGGTTLYLGNGSTSIYLYGASFFENTCTNSYLAITANPEYAGVNGCQLIKFGQTSGGASKTLSLTGAKISDGGDFSCYFTMRCRAGSGAASMILLNDSTALASGIKIEIDTSTGPPFKIKITTNQAGTSSSLTSSAAIIQDQMHSISIIQNSGTCTIRVDGVSVASGALTNAITPTAAYAISDATSPFYGELGEVLNYNVAHNSTDRNIIEEMMTAEFVRTPIYSKTSLSTSDLVGSFSQDFIDSFSTSSAFRYWWLELAGTTDVAFHGRHSKIFFGEPFDFNVELDNYTPSKVSKSNEFISSVGECRFLEVQDPYYKFILDWVGSADDKIRDFSNLIMPLMSQTGVFVYTTSYHQVLNNRIALYGKIIDHYHDNSFEKNDYNKSLITFEEQLG